MPVTRSMERILEPSHSIETAITFLSFGGAFIFNLHLCKQKTTVIVNSYLLTKNAQSWKAEKASRRDTYAGDIDSVKRYGPQSCRFSHQKKQPTTIRMGKKSLAAC